MSEVISIMQMFGHLTGPAGGVWGTAERLYYILEVRDWNFSFDSCPNVFF